MRHITYKYNSTFKRHWSNGSPLTLRIHDPRHYLYRASLMKNKLRRMRQYEHPPHTQARYTLKFSRPEKILQLSETSQKQTRNKVSPKTNGEAMKTQKSLILIISIISGALLLQGCSSYDPVPTSQCKKVVKHAKKVLRKMAPKHSKMTADCKKASDSERGCIMAATKAGAMAQCLWARKKSKPKPDSQ